MGLHNLNGKRGEDIAAEHLRKKGYKIIERNYKVSGGEIDIIASKNKFLVFVEVKTRSSLFAGRPAESVTAQKRARIIKAAKHYILKNGCRRQPRFDVVEVILEKENFSLKEIVHLENVFC